MEVVVADKEQMNLLGLFMKAALEPRADAVARAGVEGDIAMTAGEMSVTLGFEPQRVTITKGVKAKPRAHLKGSLESLVQVARGNVARELLTRRARISGSPLAALPLAKVFRERP